ncbi:murein biosynthesis integral membrane protein MurJ [Propionibacterium sp.]|uniref:murein biosynthesis integral membrane protein MurJ n=1 Tax=Propionibacterium sp. TaxID=1977903 RepID=UPI0039E90C23
MAEKFPASEEGQLDAEIDASDHKNLGRNSALMASGTLVSRVLGMVNAMLLAKVVGQDLAAEAFRSANTLPNFILVLLSGGILNAVLLPQITKAMKRADGGRQFVDRLLGIAFALIFFVALLSTVGAGALMQITDLNGAAMHLAIAFAYLCMPQVLFYGIFAIFGNLLNARGSFGPFGWAPVVNNMVAIGGEIVFLHMWGQQSDPTVWTHEMVLVLAGSATLGIVAQTLVLIPVLYRSGFRWRPRWGLRGYGFSKVGRFAGLTFIALCIAQAGGLYVMRVSTGMLGRAAPGEYVAGYAAYQNAMMLFQMPYSLIAFSLLTALFPQLARAWQRRGPVGTGLGDMRQIIRQGLTLPAVGIIPASMVLIVLARPLVRGIFWGLRPYEAAATANVLMVMALSTMAYTIATLQQQYCFATEQGGANLVMQCLATVVQVGFAVWALFVPPAYGVLVICLGMLVSNSVLAFVFLGFAYHQVGGLDLGSVAWLHIRLGLASIVGAVPAIAVQWVVHRWLGDALMGQYLLLVVGGLLFLTGFMVGVKLFRITEFQTFARRILSKLHPAH